MLTTTDPIDPKSCGQLYCLNANHELIFDGAVCLLNMTDLNVLLNFFRIFLQIKHTFVLNNFKFN